MISLRPARRTPRTGSLERLSVGGAARLARAGSLLAQLGHLDRAIALNEEAVARDPLESFPWFDLGRLLAQRYAESEDAGVRRASVARAVEVLERARELGLDLDRQTGAEAFDAMREEPAFQSLLGR